MYTYIYISFFLSCYKIIILIHEIKHTDPLYFKKLYLITSLLWKKYTT